MSRPGFLCSCDRNKWKADFTWFFVMAITRSKQSKGSKIAIFFVAWPKDEKFHMVFVHTFHSIPIRSSTHCWFVNNVLLCIKFVAFHDVPLLAYDQNWTNHQISDFVKNCMLLNLFVCSRKVAKSIMSQFGYVLHIKKKSASGTQNKLGFVNEYHY